MENTNTVLAENIAAFRKQKELTQNEFAQRLGVTFQAVSKWENARSAPDIGFLPQMADIFECTIDGLFSRAPAAPPEHSETVAAFPWEDDGILRGVVYNGHKLLTCKEGLTEKFTFEIIGEAKQVHSECDVSVKGNVNGDCEAGHSITLGGSVFGGCNAGHSVAIGGNCSGECNAGHSISIGNNLSGDAGSGNSISVGNNIEGDVGAGQKNDGRHRFLCLPSLYHFRAIPSVFSLVYFPLASSTAVRALTLPSGLISPALSRAILVRKGPISS